MSGCIGIPCSDTARYTAFTDSLSNLEKPSGTTVRFAVCTWRARGRNELVRWMLEAGDEWMLFLDDDHVFAPDLLTRLLAHDKDIVGALCMTRAEPYSPFCFSEIITADPPQFRHVDLQEHGEELIRVAAVGTGAMLIRRYVFEAMDDPWFKIAETGEDMLFCMEASEQFNIYCDLASPIGHLTTAVVWPVKKEEWKVGLVVSDETRILRPLPPAVIIEA